MLISRLATYRQLFPHKPQQKGSQKGKRPSPGNPKGDWQSKIFKTASGQRIQGAIEKGQSKGKTKGPAAEKGKGYRAKGKDKGKGDGDEGKGKGKDKDKVASAAPGVQRSPPPAAASENLPMNSKDQE